MNRPDEVIAGTMAMGIPVYGEDGEDVGKLPLCGLVPEFDQEITGSEDLDNEDEILAAYEDDEKDDWFATSQISPDSSDEDGGGQGEERDDEGEEGKDEDDDEDTADW